MNKISEEALQGAKVILRDCLGLHRDQELVILIDETTYAVAPAIYRVAEQLGIRYTIILVPLNLQKKVKQLSDMPIPFQDALIDARAILTCINGDTLHTDFRHVILHDFVRAHTRIGHMPGATLAVIEAANVDLKALSKACHNLELPLARGHELELITYDQDGHDYHLHAQIGGWQRLPVASDGLVPDGAWGNVPSGETYIAPLEYTAYGHVYIDGALEKLIIQPRAGILLSFVEGRLVPPQPPYGLVAQRLMEEARPSLEIGDPNWTALAEVGIGLNKAIKRPTGNMLLDEKINATAHIAIGRNTDLGGRIASNIHCDMVVLNPTILVDHKPIIERGRLVLRHNEWQEDYNRFPSNLPIPCEAEKVARTATEVRYKEGRLYRIAHSDTGHTASFQVGAENTAREAAKLYQSIPTNRESISVARLARSANLELRVARRVLAVMDAFEVVHFEPRYPKPTADFSGGK